MVTRLRRLLTLLLNFGTVGLWGLAGLLGWWLLRLAVLPWLAVLPGGLAQVAIALWLSPLFGVASAVLPTLLAWLLLRRVGRKGSWRGSAMVKRIASLIPPLLLLGAIGLWGQFDTQGTTAHLNQSARRGNLLRLRQQLLVETSRHNLSWQTSALLSAGTNPNFPNPHGKTALAVTQDPAIMAQLLAAGARPSGRALVNASFWADLDRVEQLLATTDDDGASLVAVAGKASLAELVQTTAGNPADRAAIAAALLERGADPDAMVEGFPLLTYAVRSRQLALVETLLAAEADPNNRDRRGDMPLHYAVFPRFSPGDDTVAIVEALLAAEADPNQFDLSGCTPLHSLIVHHRQGVRSQLPPLIYRPSPHPNDPEAQTYQAQLNLELVTTLVNQGASVRTPSCRGQNAIALAEGDDALVERLEAAP
jgi:ankyrin repeat protein